MAMRSWVKIRSWAAMRKRLLLPLLMLPPLVIPSLMLTLRHVVVVVVLVVVVVILPRRLVPLDGCPRSRRACTETWP